MAGWVWGWGPGGDINDPIPVPTFGYQEKPESEYPVNSDISHQSRDRFGRVPTGSGFVAMSSDEEHWKQVLGEIGTRT